MHTEYDLVISNGRIIDGGGNPWYTATIFDNATFEDPLQPPEGISRVIVNGEVAVEEGSIAGASRRHPISLPTRAVLKCHTSYHFPCFSLRGMPSMPIHK